MTKIRFLYHHDFGQNAYYVSYFDCIFMFLKYSYSYCQIKFIHEFFNHRCLNSALWRIPIVPNESQDTFYKDCLKKFDYFDYDVSQYSYLL